MADQQKPITPADIDHTIDTLLDLVSTEAERIRAEQDKRVSATRKPGRVRTTSPSKPDVTDLLREDLRSALERGAVVAPHVGDDGEIDPSEFEREIMKRALIRLKVSDLREEARDAGIDWRGKEEELADRLARAFKFDEQAIAELVLRYEDQYGEKPPRGLSDRVYSVSGASSNLAAMSLALRSMRGRYVRVGVARWFVFESVEFRGEALAVTGRFRSFQAEATEEDNDFSITPREVSALATAVFEPGDDLVRVRSKGTREAVAALAAIERVTSIGRNPAMPVRFDVPPSLMSWDRGTLFLLDLVAHAFNDEPLFVRNLTSAHFETNETEIIEGEAQPRIRSVTFSGDWVGDSPQVCQLLVERRRLVAVSLLMKFEPNQNETYFFPMRVGFGRDHIEVSTGFGKERQAHALAAHRVVLDRAESGLARLWNSNETVRLIDRIVERADAEGNVSIELFGPAPRGDDDAQSN